MVFIIVAGFTTFLTTGYIAYQHEVRGHATTITDQVLAFRFWAANTQGVWVTEIHPDFPDYLATKTLADGGLIYQKNPALGSKPV